MNGLYPGSFDMFTNGHLSVLEQAVNLFDTVYLCVSQNPMKKRRYTIESCINAINKAIEDKPYRDKVVILVSDSSIPAEIAKEYGCSFIVRGIRNVTDYMYEDGLATFNSEFENSIKTLYLRAEHSEISSTMVHSFMQNGIDIDSKRYLPYPSSYLKGK